MNLILEGIVVGLSLALLLGPIFIALTQTSIEKGFRAGVTVGSGIWLSDLLIMLVSYFFIRTISPYIEDSEFKFWMGAVGGAVMIAFGVVIAWKSKETIPNTEKQKHGLKNYFKFFMKGFLVNTINPFTFIFWLGIISAYVITRGISPEETLLFLGTILLVIMLTDTLKVLLAKALRSKLTPKAILWLNRIAGLGLTLFGVFLIYRVW